MSESPLATNGDPLYRSIAKALAERIRNRELKPGDSVPSEAQLMRQYGVSRVTVRQAITELARAGSVTARQGKGTFVTGPTVAQPMHEHTLTLVEAFRVSGMEPEISVVNVQQMAPPQHVASALGSSGESVVRLCRLYCVEGAPVAVAHLYLPLAMAGVAFLLAQPENLGQTSYAIIEQRMGIPIGTARHKIHAVAVDTEIARLLALDAGATCLAMDRLTYSEQGHALQFMQFFYAPGRMAFEITSTRHAPAFDLKAE